MSGANAPAANAPPQDQGKTEQRSQEPSMEEILASIRRIISDDQMLPLSPRASVPPLPPNRPDNEAAARTGSPAQDKAQEQERDPVAMDRESDRQAGAQAHDISPAGHRATVVDRHENEDHDDDDVLDLAEVAEHAHAPNHRVHEIEATHAVPAGEAAEPIVTATSEPTAEPPSVAVDPPTTTTTAPAAAAALPAAERDAEFEHEPILSDNTVSSVSSSFHQLAATMLMQNFPPVDQIARELLRPMIKTWLDDNLPVMVERLVRAEIERVARVGR